MEAKNLVAGTYKVDINHSNVAFKVRHLMIANVKGQFTNFSGTFTLDDKTLQSLEGVANISSVNTNSETRDKHLQSADFFDLQKYPTITLMLDKVKGDIAYGKLTIRGITKDIEMRFETSGMTVKDPWGSMRAGLSLSGSISRKDFGLTWNETIESGGFIAGDSVIITIELEGVLGE